MLLKNKVALVTGAAAGIGEGIARMFASEGAQVLLWDRDEMRNRSTADAISKEHGLARAVTVDVTDVPAIRQAVEAATAEFGGIDILVNNAGIFPRKLFVDMSEDEWDHMQNVNLKSMFHTIKAIVPGMLARRSGKIVNISSVTFHLGTPNLSHYVASKGGVIGLTRSLSREFGVQNVYINCITPGAIQTESEKNFVNDEQAAEMVGHQSLKRRITPLDVARVALFLSSALSDGMTGQTLNVDGGWVVY